MSKKVTIELTPEQREKIKAETGKDMSSLDFEALEDRNAPSVFGKGKGGRDGMTPTDPEV